ncbi:MAG: hypothetical protein IPI46_04535 [Bacteroidetes bacterium]|nr:hypothetical protein [Bacteroidota bacterium]
MATFLHTLDNFKQTIKANLVWIIGVALIVATVQAIISKSIDGVSQTHSKIFPLSINKGGGASPIDAIKMQFGISDKTDYEKIYNVNELVTSKTISTNIVKTKPANKKYKNYAEWLLDDYNEHLPFWKSKIIIEPRDTSSLYITGAGLLLDNTTIDNDIKTGFTTIYTKAHDEALALACNEAILKELSDFYILMSTEKPRTDLYKIKIMRDSLQDELSDIERAIAGFMDSNQYSAKTETQLPQYRLMRMQKEIEELYTITATSYQNAKFKLLSESPIFQVLDYAGAPYDYTKPNWKKLTLIAFVVTFFLMCLWVCRKIFGRLIIEELSA